MQTLRNDVIVASNDMVSPFATCLETMDYHNQNSVIVSCRYLLKHKVLCCLIQLVYILLNHHLIKGLCQQMYAGDLNPEKSGPTIRT